MSGSHLALVVDDDRYILEEVESMLISLGHECRLARTQEEALELLEKERFCYVVLDLGLKVNSGSAKARMQTGFNILSHIRKLDGNVPVIIMTAHGKAHELSVRAFKMGATDYIKKPFDQEAEPLEDKIREAMARTCEARSAVCPNVSSAKRKPTAPEKPAVKSRYSAKDSFRLVGILRKRRYLVEINGKEAWIPLQAFELLCRLAFSPKKDEAGWLHTSDMEISGNVHQAIRRLREAIGEYVKDLDVTVENDGHGNYRLSVPPDNVSLDRDSLQIYHSRLAGLLP